MGNLTIYDKIVRNPAFGLVPLILFSFVMNGVPVLYNLGVGFVLSVLGLLLFKRTSRLIFEISFWSFLSALLAHLLIPKLLSPDKVFLIIEIVFIIALILTRVSRQAIINRLSRSNVPPYRNFLSESFRVALQIQYGLSLHLLVGLLVAVINNSFIYTLESAWFVVFAQIVIIGVVVLQSIRMHWVHNKLKREDWLPIVTEQGNVTGRVAKSVTQSMKNKFMHPVVRVALIHKGKIYLKQRSSTKLLNPELLDYPFEQYMDYNNEIDKTVHELLAKECGTDSLPLRFLLKYIFENEETKRLIFLYVSIIDDEDEFQQLTLGEGKLWTESQIADNLGHHLFSECFELEFEYLKNTILLWQNVDSSDNVSSSVFE